MFNSYAGEGSQCKCLAANLFVETENLLKKYHESQSKSTLER